MIQSTGIRRRVRLVDNVNYATRNLGNGDRPRRTLPNNQTAKKKKRARPAKPSHSPSNNLTFSS